jgi:hypothetical protein
MMALHNTKMLSNVRHLARKLCSPDETGTQCVVAGLLLVFEALLSYLIFLKVPCELGPMHPRFEITLILKTRQTTKLKTKANHSC